ncbi:MAG: ABC transporter permease, partial [Eubacterium sp.]|nr:ABC transporter permease [Eubacterium sp.]
DDNNPYFTAKPPESAQNVVVSSALAEKFGLKPGEDFVVTDDENDQKYAFNIDSISECECGFYVFINIDKMREMFDKADNYYNVLFSDKKLDIDSGRLYSVTSRQDVVKGASVFSDLMMPMVFTLTFASIAIFCVVMYLMMKVMIDRSAMSISLVKIFGYRRREIKKLYLDGNFAIIAVGAALIIPITKQLMNLVFPYMVSNVNCGLNLSCPIYVYFIMYAVIIGLYLGINALLVRKLDKYTPAEILKDRD